MNDFKTPPDHVNFLAKRLFGNEGEIIDGAVARIEPGGGGPVTPHVHDHAHLFIVVEGEAVVRMPGRGDVVIAKNGSYTVDGGVLHSVWNNADSTTIMIGISVKK